MSENARCASALRLQTICASLCVLLCASLPACNDDPGPTTSRTIDSLDGTFLGADAAPPDGPPDAPLDSDVAPPDAPPDAPTDAATDAPTDAVADADADADADLSAPPIPVEVDLAPYLTSAPDPEDSVRVFVAASQTDLLGGLAAQGRLGDFILENGRARFVVEQADRVIGPCPYGGNVIDAAVRTGDDTFAPDVVGEVCLFAYLGQTLSPDTFEILADGADGGAGVLAVTGRLDLLDFINLTGAVEAFAPGLNIRFPVDPSDRLPLAVTVYYVLRPGDTAVQVITAVRNDGRETVHVPFGHLIDSGGEVEFYNPLSSLGGFGYNNLGAESIVGEPLPFLAFRGADSTYAYAPEPDPSLENDLPISGGYLSVSGVAVSLLGTNNLIAAITANPAALDRTPGFVGFEPGASHTILHRLYVGGGGVADIVDAVLADHDVATGAVNGTVTYAGGDDPAAGARVTAIDAEGRGVNQALSGADGTYAMRLPAGTYTLRAFTPGGGGEASGPVTVVGDDEHTAPIEVGAPGTLEVTVRRPDGDPTPARVTVWCVGPCPLRPGNAERAVITSQPSNTQAIEYTGVDGVVSIELPEGDYRVTVTRGVTWSVWPPDAPETGGDPITITSGATVTRDAEIAQVVDTRGALSGDFHVHSINSPDSPVPLQMRVRNFMGEGVDVLVATDHDRISDVEAAVEAEGAGDEVAGIVGVELTTFDYGHYNSFPLTVDEDSRNGGAVDWAGGDGPGLAPREFFAALHEFPGEQVIQINHPNTGYFSLTGADVLRGTTRTDPASLRLEPQPGATEDPIDTGLWSEDFTALEVLNGTSMSRFWICARWWLTMVGRGFTPTATAVTDTHRLFADLGGIPRSFVFLDDDDDTPGTIDRDAFARAVNAGRLIGSAGPFFRVLARNETGDEASLGDVLATNGEAVTLEVTVEVPAWMDVDTVEVYMNLGDDVLQPLRGYDDDPLVPTLSQAIDWDDDTDYQVVTTGDEEHARWRRTVTFSLETDVDAYVVVMVRSLGGGASMFPLVGGGVTPFAYANPFYLDADGDGYDDPELLARIASADTGASALLEWQQADEVDGASAPPQTITEAQLIELLRAMDAHGHHHGDGVPHDHGVHGVPGAEH